ncbi:MAG: c-type cytochrome [Betaproteobacteria bacterium]
MATVDGRGIRVLLGAPAAAATLLVGLGSSPAAHADTQALQTLMLRNNCMACHLIDKRKYGPHFQEVAAKYAGKAGAVATLAAKIRAGGSGVWGDDMMPPQPSVTEANAKAMAELILALKP